MRLPWRRPPAPEPPHASPLRTAVLEAEELGIWPEPGTTAYAVTALRAAFRPPRNASPLAIAVLEAEELGIEPEPGTAAAAVVALRAAFGSHDTPLSTGD